MKQLQTYCCLLGAWMALAMPAHAGLINTPITVTETGKDATLMISVTWQWVAQPDDGNTGGLVFENNGTFISDDYGHSFYPQFPFQPDDQMKIGNWPNCIPDFAPLIFAHHYHLHVELSTTADAGQQSGTQYGWDMWFWIYNDGSRHDITMDPTQGELGSPDATAPPCLATETPPAPTCGSGSTSGTTGGTTGGSSTGSTGGGASDNPNFWTSLFEPDDAHVSALKQAEESLHNAGPWGQVGSVAGRIGDTSRNNAPLFPATIGFSPKFASGAPGGTAGDSTGTVVLTLPMPGHDFTTKDAGSVGIDAPGNPPEPIGTPWTGASHLSGWRDALLGLIEWSLVAMAAVAFCLWLKGKVNI